MKKQVAAIARHVVLLAMLGGAAGALAFSPRKETFAADVFWKANASSLPKSQIRHLEKMACQARNINTEVLIAVGHASADEKLPQQLGLKRAESVKAQMVELGVPAARIYIESKGASQPAPGGASSSRRVELELIGTRSPDGRPQECDPQWLRDMLSLPPSQAMVVVRAQLREGWIKPSDPLVLAVNNNRQDLLGALLAPDSGVVLDAGAKQEVWLAAAAARNAGALLKLHGAGGRSMVPATGSRALFLATCGGSNAQSSSMADTVRVLLQAGEDARAAGLEMSGLNPLGCAASSGDLDAVGLLVRAGANLEGADEYVPILVGARHREVVALLLAAGASPLARSPSGHTLFHGYRMRDAADVRWLAGLGLDVNARTQNGGTPLAAALPYAGVDVLEAFKLVGASLADPSSGSGLLQNAWVNPAVRAWLLDQGVTPTDWAAVVVQEVSMGVGDARLPVLRAVSRRGVPLMQWGQHGSSTLSVAIDALAPGVVELLLRDGADTTAVTRPPQRVDTALFRALNVPLQPVPLICIHCAPGWYDEQLKRLSAPEVLAEREARRARIVRMLQDKEAMP